MNPSRAGRGDIPRLLAFAQDFHAASGQPFGFDPDAMTSFLTGLIEGGVVFVSDNGMICGVIAPAYCDPKWTMAVELMWWAKGDGIALLKAFEGWAEEQGASEVRMTSLASLNRADRLLKVKGYAPAEISYRKVM